MTAVRGVRPVSVLLAFVIALLIAVAGAPAPSSAAAGEISGQVVDTNLVGLDGLTVMLDDGSDPPVYQTTTTAGGGNFSFSPAADGDYDVVVLGGDDHLDYDSGLISYDSSDADSGDLGLIVLDDGRRITGVVKDAATGNPLEGILVLAVSATSSGFYAALPPTGSNGEYSIGVPAGDDYYLLAFDGNIFSSTPGIVYDPQLWDHVNYTTLIYSCGCTLGDPVTVDATWPGAAVADIDFDLLNYSDWIYFSVLAERLPAPATEYPGLRVILDKWDTATSSWVLDVASDVTDAYGYADLFGYGAGDYRIRYTAGGVALAVVSYDDYSGGPYPLYDGGKSVEFPTLYPSSPGCGCGLSGFEVQELDLIFPAGSTGGGGGGTPASRTSRTGTSFPGSVPTVTPTPTPTPTPSASPSSSPSSAPAPGPSESPTPEPEPSGAAMDLWWLWIVLAILAAIVVVLIGRAVLRR